MSDETSASHETIVTHAADTVDAPVSKNSVAVSDVSMLVRTVHAALVGRRHRQEPAAHRQHPAGSIRASVKPGLVICLEEGKDLTTLKRPLKTRYPVSPDNDRGKWALPAGYPMVAPNYAAQRRTPALSIGLGRNPDARQAKR